MTSEATAEASEGLSEQGTVDGALQVRFGTFAGVVRPGVLTVLGALLYLREGWLVGNAGLGGALMVIFAAFAITNPTP